MDYQVFEHLSIQDDTMREDYCNLPRSVLDRATSAKLKLENNYKAVLQEAIERNER